MNFIELKKEIIDAADPKWYNQVEETIVYDSIGKEVKLKGVISIYKYAIDQMNEWAKLFEELPWELKESNRFTNEIQSRIENFVNRHKEGSGEALSKAWRPFSNYLRNVRSDVFPADCAEIYFLKELHNLDQDIFEGAYSFFIGGYEISSKNNFVGFLQAFEFSEKGKLPISKRVKSERALLRRLDNNYNDRLAQSDAQLVEHLAAVNKNYDSHVKSMADFKKEKEDTFSQWFNNSRDKTENFEIDSFKKMFNLEQTYEVKLRLEKPATFWKERSAKLNKEGWYAMHSLIALVLLSVVCLTLILLIAPEALKVSFKTNPETAIKSAIIYLMIVSILAFGIRITTRVAFSSFHLARDAEEREQLTHVYLALKNNTDISQEERNLIIQSLFSRADSGLLKEDSSPTMPNDIIGKLISK